VPVVQEGEDQVVLDRSRREERAGAVEDVTGALEGVRDVLHGGR
jgi:hypothetical protein